MIWVEVPDGDPVARQIFFRHYTRRRYRDGRPQYQFVGPGEKMVLLAIDHSALFTWRKFKTFNGQDGVNCSVFRNEGRHRSSDLILQAEEFARQRWPTDRFYTYINPKKIRSTNPGFCFLKAGWRKCGKTKKYGLIIMEKHP